MSSERYDVVIIGSGPGGGTMAWRLAKTGKRILLLERGDYGSVRYAVLTRGKTLQFAGIPGTTFALPRGTLDERRWRGATPVSRLCSLQAGGLTHWTKLRTSAISN
jgi:choline dehydrogenase-like flavoprotein